MKKYELRKGLVIGIIILMIGVNTNLSIARDIAEEPTSLIVLDDELDQYQTFCDGVMELGYVEDYNFKYAQSFIPQKNILTRVFIYAERVGQPYPFHLAIRKGLEEENLTAVSVDYNNIPYDLTWVEFDFVDIPVIVGETYYMIMSTQTKLSTIYGVGLGSPNPYLDGGFWCSIDWQEWGELFGEDLCFKTYGYGGPPNIPEIDGPINGEIGITYDYNFTAIDPDEDDVWYYIEWGDGDVEEWIGPYSSGEEVVRSHTWDDEDTYTIRAKAKDIFDAESEPTQFLFFSYTRTTT